MIKRALVLGAGGFIGSHMVSRLKREGFWVRAADLKEPDFSPSKADEFMVGDLRDQLFCAQVLDGFFDEIYQFAADMGGAGYIFTGDKDADIMHNSATINLNICHLLTKFGCGSVFYSSSACMYPEHNQLDPDNPNCEESSAYPANPDSEYGWEKLFSERLYLSFARNYGIKVRVARYHNIFGPEGTWTGGKEKAPAAICRKVAEVASGDSIEVWGSGKQTRSFLFIDECIEGTIRLMRSTCDFPVNIGSEESVSINKLVEIVSEIAGKSVLINNIPGPTGVNGRNSHNDLIFKTIGWRPSQALRQGLETTYSWIESQIEACSAIESCERAKLISREA